MITLCFSSIMLIITYNLLKKTGKQKKFTVEG